MTCSLGARHSPWEFNGINSELQHCREWIRFWKFVLFADRCVDSGHRKQRGDNRGGGIFPIVPLACEHGTNLILIAFNCF